MNESESNGGIPANEALPRHAPTVPGAGLAVGAGVLAVALLIDTTPQRQALAIEVVGLGVVAAGYAAWRRRRRIAGAFGAAAGAVLVAIGFLVAIGGPPSMIHRFELLPGMIGLVVLCCGLLPIRAGRERTLVTLGTALLFVGVVTSGVVRGATLLPVLLAGVATVLAWDLGEQAVSLGRQVGREAGTIRAELAHVAGTLLAGLTIVALTLGIDGLDIQGLSLAGFLVLLVAGLVLAVALRH